MLKFKYIIGIALILLGVLLICEPFVYVSFWWYILLCLMVFLVIAVGSFSMGWGLFLKAFTRNPNITKKKIAITFDDGPNEQFTPKVLQLLKEYNAKATFFCIGRQVKKYPEVLKQIQAAGHQIGNHSYSHGATIDFKSTEEWLEELKTTDQAIFKFTGAHTGCFRPPYGVTTPHLAKAVKVTGHNVIGWNIRSLDMVIKNPKRAVGRVLQKVKPGSVILLHDTHDRIETVLEQLLQFLTSQGYEMVTVNDLLYER